MEQRNRWLGRYIENPTFIPQDTQYIGQASGCVAPSLPRLLYIHYKDCTSLDRRGSMISIFIYPRLKKANNLQYIIRVNFIVFDDRVLGSSVIPLLAKIQVLGPESSREEIKD